jgi:hypothetical protein
LLALISSFVACVRRVAEARRVCDEAAEHADGLDPNAPSVPMTLNFLKIFAGGMKQACDMAMEAVRAVEQAE